MIIALVVGNRNQLC